MVMTYVDEIFKRKERDYSIYYESFFLIDFISYYMVSACKKR